MLKLILSLFILLFFTACVDNVLPKSEKKQEKYVPFKDYNEEVAPLIDKGYAVVKDLYFTDKQNRTPEFFEKLLLRPTYSKANFVIVGVKIQNGIYTYRAIFLRKVDTSKMILLQ